MKEKELQFEEAVKPEKEIKVTRARRSTAKKMAAETAEPLVSEAVGREPEETAETTGTTKKRRTTGTRKKNRLKRQEKQQSPQK